MPYAESLWLFLLLLTGIIIVPGMDMVFVLGHSLTRGSRAGLMATLGIMMGGAFFAVFGSLGAASVIALVPALATPMVLIGSGYMMWIGFTLTRSAITINHIGGQAALPLVRICLQGLLTCLLNPKAWLFTFAVYPQFISPTFGAIWHQTVVLVIMTVTVQGVIYGGLALLASRSRDVIVTSPTLTVWTGRLVGGLLIAIAGYIFLRALIGLTS